MDVGAPGLQCIGAPYVLNIMAYEYREMQDCSFTLWYETLMIEGCHVT